MAKQRPLPAGFTRLQSGRIRWRVSVAGKRHTGTADTLTEARRARAQASIAAGGEAVETVTVGELVDNYIRTAAATLAPASLATDTRALNTLPPAFRARDAADVTLVTVSALWAQLAADGVPASRVHRLAGVMSQAWKKSAALGWVTSNPFAQVRPPRPAQPDEVDPPSVAEVRRLIEECRTPEMRLMVRLAAMTGARRGELTALQWQDIRLDVGEIVIRRSLAEVGNQLHQGQTKTGRKGHRTIPLDEATIRMIRKHQRVVGCDWVFTHDGYTPWRPPYVTLEFQRTRNRCGVPCSFNGLRHFAATHWLGTGVAPSTVAGFLGHTTVATVFRHYAHFIPARGREVITAHAAALDA